MHFSSVANKAIISASSTELDNLSAAFLFSTMNLKLMVLGYFLMNNPSQIVLAYKYKP